MNLQYFPPKQWKHIIFAVTLYFNDVSLMHAQALITEYKGA